MKRSLILLLILSLVVPVLFLGCSGDDGSQGAQGIQGVPGNPGIPGPPGPGVAASPESCGVCHSSVASIHAATGVATASLVSVTTGASVIIAFTVSVDGVLNNSFELRRAYVNWDNTARQTVPPTLITSFQRDTLYSVADNGVVTTDVGLTFSKAAGSYTVTIPTAYQIDNSTYLIQLKSATSSERPVVVAQLGAAHLRNLVTNDGCNGCHGPYPAWSEKFQHYAVGGPDCQICHSRYNQSTEIRTKNAAGGFDVAGPFPGTNLAEYVHGIHNSHNMPDGVYYRTSAPDDAPYTTEDRYSIGYPSDMRDCRTCHRTDAQLAAAASAPVSYYLCMTCHNNWDGFVDHHSGEKLIAATGGLSFHRSFDPETVNCMLTGGCHGSLPAKNEAADFHIDISSSDLHYDSFFGGEDISFANPDAVSFAITGVTKAGDNVTFTWTASKNGSAVNPCNDNLALGPTFRGLGAYLAYAKGDDWVNENVGSSPGQPASARNLFTSLATTCAANVATTRGLVVDPDANAYADKALLAIGGKPIDRKTFIIGTTPTAGDYFIRFPSPTYAFSMATGSAVGARRNAVNNDKCLACHRGTLYQHGGDRVDNEQLCVICHNPSSSDKNNRVFFKILNADNTVDTDSTYDGKVAETYDMRYMIHAIHGAEKRTNPLVIYRTRGIYAFAPPVYEIVSGERVEKGYPKPTGWPTTESTTERFPIFGSDNNSTQIHNWIVVHYPKPASDCLACHNAGLFEAPDQTKAVALTVDSGTSNLDQSDDTVIGPTAGACTACHATSPVKSHANQFGYRTNITKDELLELAGP